MRITKILLVYTTFILFSSLITTVYVNAFDEDLPNWNKNWSYKQEINIPISLNNSNAKFQPIDIKIIFDNPCWTKSENHTSVRVVCWDGNNWCEIESQIYDLKFLDNEHIDSCGLVFLIPEYVNGDERFFVYYDDTEKSPSNYPDHVSIEDAYYFDSPISELQTEAKYYSIKEDGYCIYGVGQEGQLLDRSFSQIIVKQKDKVEDFDVINSDQITSFAFSYYYGNDEKDESSSDQTFIYKKIFVDGNLMVEFGIISESNKKDVRTTAVYKYYYCPTEDKRISVHVKHEILQDIRVKGKVNIDGRFGAILSIKSRNPAIKKLNLGEIYPYLHFFDKNNNIQEYQMIVNPETKDREWIISYLDDADLGSEAWIANGMGNDGKTNSVIFSSDKNIVSGFDEKDGIQLKVAEREYFNFLGTEVDYASINFGRNSYEKGTGHDLTISKGTVYEFDAEMFSVEEGGYQSIQKESNIYQKLIKYRHLTEDPSFENEKKRFNLAIINHFGGSRLSFPRLSEKIFGKLPVIWIELYQDGKIVASGPANKSFFVKSHKMFEDIVEGTYVVKVYWKIGNIKYLNGAKVVNLDDNKLIHIFCTWEKVIQLNFIDQNGNGIPGVEVFLQNNQDVNYDYNETDENGKITFIASFNSRDPYKIKAYYRNFLIYQGYLPNKIKRVSSTFDLELHDLTIEVFDEFNLPPGIDVTPTLSMVDDKSLQLTPEKIQDGKYFFSKIPSGKYSLQISYGNNVDEKIIEIPQVGNLISLKFTAMFSIQINLFDSKGNSILNNDVIYKIFRDDNQVFSSKDEMFSIPPGKYEIEAYSDNKLIGLKNIDLTSNRTVTIVTTLESLIPLIVAVCLLTFIIVLLLILYLRKISLSTFLKLFTIILLVSSIFLPWWGLSGHSDSPEASRDINLYLSPQVMIEKLKYQEKTQLDVSEMPIVFIDLLQKLVYVVYISIILLSLSTIMYKLKKKSYSLLLTIISITILIVLSSLFFIGTSKITELSIGDLYGQGHISALINTQEISFLSSWGLDYGFYVIICSIVILFISLFFDLRSYVKSKKKKL